MLAPKYLPAGYSEWNHMHGAPFGYSKPLVNKLKRLMPKTFYWKVRGPFSIQKNNSTREFEYPFVYHQLPDKKNLRILDVGGGLSGFQFVLSRNGHIVFNVDPGMAAAGKGWPCNHDSIDQLNKIFETNVKLFNSTIDKVKMHSGSLDCVTSISVIEHLPEKDIYQVVKRAWQLLKPGGLFILTIDLFLDIEPFAQQTENKYGRNINVQEFIAMQPFELVLGDKSELFGFSEWNSELVFQNKEKYLIGSGYPAMVQCIVLRKPHLPFE